MRRRQRGHNRDLRSEAEAAALKTSKDLYDLVSRRRRLNFFVGKSDTDTIASTTYNGHHVIDELSTPNGIDPLHEAIERGTVHGTNADADSRLERGPHPKAPPRLKNKISVNCRISEQSSMQSTRFTPGNVSQKGPRKSAESARKQEMKKIQRAWVCCCCGSVFVSKEQCSKHEFMCLRSTYKVTPSSSVSIVKQINNFDVPMDGIIDISLQMQSCIAMTDASLIQAVQGLGPTVLSSREADAEYELLQKAKDRAYYDLMANLSSGETSQDAPNQSRQGGIRILSKVRKKLSHAYNLIKEGDFHEERQVDVYRCRRNWDFKLDSDTLFINVNVKHSVLFLNDEIDRIFNERWLHMSEGTEFKDHFERLRAMAQIQAIRFAKLALSSDLTPTNVAVQLSNDLYRLFPKQLKQFGTEVKTEIEYRKKSFFVLSVSVLSIDPILLMKHFHGSAEKRRNGWTKRECPADDSGLKRCIVRVFHTYTLFEFIETILSMLYYLHWAISVPICTLLYKSFLRTTINSFIITAVTDNFYRYAEKQGMEMVLEVVPSPSQAAFVFEELRQIRNFEHDLKIQISESKDDAQDEQVVRGALLGDKVEADANAVGHVPGGLSKPLPMENIVLAIDLPVGYRRLRRAFLQTPIFFSQAVLTDGLNYKDIEYEPWDKFDGDIGKEFTPDDFDETEYIGATLKCKYLMPKSGFVGENMAYEEMKLMSYNDYFFSMDKETKNPDVPYGNTFSCLSRIAIYNCGGDRCHMECSVQAHFPNGPPFVSGQIRSAMRAGFHQVSVVISEAAGRYSGIEEANNI